MAKSVNILQQDCDPTLAQDKSLPYTAYLVEYVQEGMTKFDIATCNKVADLFDYYYDNYKKDFINFTQTEGRINPKLYGYQSKTDAKSK